jgi:hypothetical protein
MQFCWSQEKTYCVPSSFLPPTKLYPFLVHIIHVLRSYVIFLQKVVKQVEMLTDNCRIKIVHAHSIEDSWLSHCQLWLLVQECIDPFL